MQKSPAHSPAAADDVLAAQARRRETIRGALKLFRVLLDAIRRHAEWVEARHGIGAPHLWALWEMQRSSGLRAVDLAKFMAVHRQTAETLLAELLARQLARQEGALFFATEAGLGIAAAAPEYGQGVLKAALEHLPDASLEQLVDTLRALAEVLPMREDRAALKPLAELLRPSSAPSR